ncbi:hypothetical protein RBB56_18120 [Kineothrix sp. MB12-C1]|nr:hypothetical protein [Kineothrix sp. MB12-C1]WMC92704.1 hypothetical protein RBB56_18120 [Kineothrix sp. MB12-C1]
MSLQDPVKKMSKSDENPNASILFDGRSGYDYPQIQASGNGFRKGTVRI